ncbi:MAG TPA: hypothetical protein VGW38_09260 [Chloroflexota bacterium]|nr:hypothetical protein [Chloroflexota bacterium]
MAGATVKSPVTLISFTREKDTKNTVRFSEVVPDDDSPIVGTLYVQKHALKALGSPDSLTVSITPAG